MMIIRNVKFLLVMRVKIFLVLTNAHMNFEFSEERAKQENKVVLVGNRVFRSLHGMMEIIRGNSILFRLLC